jgi:hypothetical protein
MHSRASVPLLFHLAMDPTLGWSGLVEGVVPSPHAAGQPWFDRH